MSIIHDALKQSVAEKQTVIQVPRSAAVTRRLFIGAYFLAIAAFAAAGVGLWLAHREHARNLALTAQVSDLSDKHENLMRLINNNNIYLDTRVQLQVAQLESDLKTLSARVDDLMKDKNTFKAESLVKFDEIKYEAGIVAKRLHNVERDHSILSDRMDALQSKQTKSDNEIFPSSHS